MARARLPFRVLLLGSAFRSIRSRMGLSSEVAAQTTSAAPPRSQEPRCAVFPHGNKGLAPSGSKTSSGRGQRCRQSTPRGRAPECSVASLRPRLRTVRSRHGRCPSRSSPGRRPAPPPPWVCPRLLLLAEQIEGTGGGGCGHPDQYQRGRTHQRRPGRTDDASRRTRAAKEKAAGHRSESHRSRVVHSVQCGCTCSSGEPAGDGGEAQCIATMDDYRAVVAHAPPTAPSSLHEATDTLGAGAHNGDSFAVHRLALGVILKASLSGFRRRRWSWALQHGRWRYIHFAFPAWGCPGGAILGSVLSGHLRALCRAEFDADGDVGRTDEQSVVSRHEGQPHLHGSLTLTERTSDRRGAGNMPLARQHCAWIAFPPRAEARGATNAA